jgi:hypothetical protein
VRKKLLEKENWYKGEKGKEMIQKMRKIEIWRERERNLEIGKKEKKLR